MSLKIYYLVVIVFKFLDGMINFGKKTCPRVLDNGQVCTGYINSGGFCSSHGGGPPYSRKTCLWLLDSGRVCGKTIISGGLCPAHGGSSRKSCPHELQNGQVCNGYIYSGDFCPTHGGGERPRKNKCRKK